MLSCHDGNYANISISGVLKDSSNHKPIPDAEINVSCWVYSFEKWESYKIEKQLKSDSVGSFTIKFEKGEALDFRINANGYKNHFSSITLSRSRQEITLFLTPN